MTREEAIDLIKLAKAEIEWEYSLEYQVAFDMAIKALEQEPKIVPIAEIKFDDDMLHEIVEETVKNIEIEPKWIPVSERLPKAGEYVEGVAKFYLVQNKYGDMLVARYTHSRYWEQIYQLEPVEDEIVAWMPLPEPYKEVEE